MKKVLFISISILILTALAYSEIMEEPEKYLVQLTLPSISRFKYDLQESGIPIDRKMVAGHDGDLDLEYRRLLEDVRDLRVVKRFKYIINCVSIEADTQIIDTLKRLSYVKQIEKMNKAIELGDDAVAIMNAGKIWKMKDPQGNPVTGSGIVVGIIDCAFNYYHHALGGGMGPGYTVIDGYDFYENDHDPFYNMVDHGTQVAGAVLSIAPKANLMLFRAYWPDECIEALTYITNNDSDPYTSDNLVDVLNISLMFGYGNASDALSLAVDNAVDHGIICTIAAGNEGDLGYYTVGTPGSSQKAITVGNYRDMGSGVVYNTSSRGPLFGSFDIKPDLCGPGYAIYLPQSYDNFIYCTGTSFSAPHVAGACALMLQAHPDWTPEYIKSVLMTSAEDIQSDSVFKQGAGNVDLVKAFSASAIVTPSSLGLGVCDPEKSSWFVEKNIRISNISKDKRTYTIKYASLNLVPGIKVFFTPSVLTIDPGKDGDFKFTCTVNNSVVPNIIDEPHSYEGFIIISSLYEQLRVPFAFIKSPVMKILLSDTAKSIIIHNSGDFIRKFGDENKFAFNQDQLIYPLPYDTYDIMTSFGIVRDTVIKESIIHNQSQTDIFINKGSACNAVEIITRDKDNQQVEEECHTLNFKNKALNIGFHMDKEYIYKFNAKPIYFSHFSSDYIFEWSSHHIADNGDYYYFNGAKASLSNDYTFENQVSDFKQCTQKFIVDPDIDEIVVSNYITDGKIGKKLQCQICSSFPSGDSDGVYKCILNYPFERNLFIMPLPYPEFRYKYMFSEVYQGFDYTNFCGALYLYPQYRLYRTPFLFAENTNILTACLPPRLDKKYSNEIFSSDIDYLESGAAPHYFSGMFINSDKQINILNNIGGGALNIFPGLNGDFIFDNEPIAEVYDEFDVKIGVIDTSPLVDGVDSIENYEAGINTGLSYYLSTPGEYEVKLSSGYTLGDVDGTCDVTAHFDTLKSDKNPPFIKNFYTSSDGKRTTHFIEGKTNIIHITTYDYENLIEGQFGKTKTIYMYYKRDDNWINLTNQIIDSYNYYCIFPDIPVEGPVYLKVILWDYNGNNVIMELNPAFTFNHLPEVVSTNLPDGITHVSAAANIIIAFNHPMDTQSVEAAFSINPAASGVFTWENDNTRMRFDNSGYYNYYTTYTYTISTDAMDPAGNHLEEPFEASFSVGM